MIKSNQRRGNYYRKTVIEEHYVIAGEPHEFYWSHVTPAGGTGLEIQKAIFQVIEETQLQNSSAIIGTDGTAFVIGKNASYVACLKAKLGRSLQWGICLLYLNELLRRHIFHKFDGATSGPLSFSGPIYKKLHGSVSTCPIENFQPTLKPEFP